MVRITVLGTSGASPTKERNLTSVALLHEGNLVLFDCGEGTQMQLLKAGINSSKIRAVMISHAHGDHVIGLAGLVRTLALNGRREKLEIFVPKGSEGTIRTLINFDKAILTYPIDIKGVHKGTVYVGKDFTISAFRLDHTISSYGYVFKMNDKRRFIEAKAKRFGIKGEMFSVLQKNGRIKLGSKTIRLSEVTTLSIGKKVVYASDTRPTASTLEAAKDADLLIHEATYTAAEASLARERGHSTAAEAAVIAKKAKAKMLVLIHFSARYKSTDGIEAEARKVFPNSKAAKDCEVIEI
ncbi:MAG: ribonuclease Z [Candidatus Micrarchaeaceae archaeon]